jgi:hypothetical protein
MELEIGYRNADSVILLLQSKLNNVIVHLLGVPESRWGREWANAFSVVLSLCNGSLFWQTSPPCLVKCLPGLKCFNLISRDNPIATILLSRHYTWIGVSNSIPEGKERIQ